MFEDRGRNKRIIMFAIYIFTGLLIRLFYLYQFSYSPLFNIPIGPDVEEYVQWAEEILAGKVLWSSVHIHSPLYPYFLSMLFRLYSGTVNMLGWVRFTQLFIGLISVLPLWFSLRMLLDEDQSEEQKKQTFLGNRITKGVFLLLWLCYPPLIFYMGELTSEVLLIPLLSLSIFFLYKSEQKTEGEGGDEEEGEPKKENRKKGRSKALSQISLAGLLAGVAVIAHPLALFFILCESLYFFIFSFARRKSSSLRYNMLRCAMFAIFAMLPLIPVVIYNTLILKEPIPLQANSGFNFYLGNSPDADGTCRIRPGLQWDRVHAEAAKQAEAQGISKDRYFLLISLRFIRDNPGKWLKLLSEKALYVWNEKELTAGADLLPLRYFTSFQRSARWAFGVVALFAIIAILINIGPDLAGSEYKNRFFRRYRHFLILLIAFWGAQTLLVTSGRYRVPMLIAVLVFASAGVASIICVIRRNRKRALLLIPAVAVAVAIVYIPTPPFKPVTEIAEAQSLLGEALIKQGHYLEAEGQLRSAAKHQPGWSRNYNLLGLISEKQEKYDEAIEYYRQAVKCDPEDPEGYLNMATLYANIKMMKTADQFFQKALSLKKATPMLYYNYALYCAEIGNLDRAVKYYQATIKLDPANIQAINNLGTIYFQQKQFSKAITYFNKALILQPHNPKRMVNIALAYLKNGDKEKAKQMLGKAASIDPEMPAVHALREMMKR